MHVGERDWLQRLKSKKMAGFVTLTAWVHQSVIVAGIQVLSVSVSGHWH